MTRMWGTPLFSIVVAVAALSLAGCYTFRADIPGHARTDLDAHVEIVGSIDEVFTHMYLLGGLLNPPPEDMLGEILLERVREANGDGIANLVFESAFEPPDVLIRTFTFFVVAPRSYRVRADIVRIHAPALPGAAVLDDKGRTP